LDSLVPVAERLYVGVQAHDHDSRELARSYGAEIVPVEWTDDFSAALNPLIAAVKEDWILRLDDDHWLDDDSHEDLKVLVERDTGVAYRVSIEDRLPNLATAYSYMTMLWRRDLGLRYKGLVHERLANPVPNSPIDPPRTNVVLHHDGMASVASMGKLTYYSGLIDRQLERDPASSYYQTYRWLALDDRTFSERRSTVQSWFAENIDDSASNAPLMASLAVRLLEAGVSGKTSREMDPNLVRRIGRKYGGRPRVNWALVGHYQAVGDNLEALQWLQEQLRAATHPLIDYSQPIDPGILGTRLYKALHTIGRREDMWAYLRFEQLSKLPLPSCRPNFASEEKAGSLWIEMRDYRALAKSLDRMGFRPSGFPLALAEANAASSQSGRMENDWWSTPEELDLSRQEARAVSLLLRDPEGMDIKWPVESCNELVSPPFKLIEGPGRLRRCRADLARFLASGPALVRLRPGVRYVEFRSIK